MSKQRKQLSERSFGAMEYFLLALIARGGLTSMYALQQRADLQPGGIRPALQRLEQSGFLIRGESASRRRRELSLTDRGKTFLNQTWKNCFSEYPDNESVIRAACVALLMGDQEFATDYLVGLAQTRQLTGKEKQMEAERLASGRLDPLSAYAWMRCLTEAQGREGASIAFSSLGRSLKEKHQPHVVQQQQQRE